MNDAAFTTVNIALGDDHFYPNVSVYENRPPILGAYLGAVDLSISTHSRRPITAAQVETAKRLAEAATEYADELEKWVQPADAGALDALADEYSGGAE